MYPNYFGLKEASFSITPDPQYLFLSEQHREALAHLLYGAGDSGGFVLLTGEVGTGKTTVCRAFLEQLPQGVDVALVLNPAMTAVELLHAICDEFRVQVPSAEQSAKALVDRLNQFLLDAHARGRRPVLIIDEAQNLRPKVMEQIRLLTNLETPKQKLLQIFLIGQPELRTTLNSPDLRQLNQRITARFHLKPLNARETAGYVDHRIAVAGVDRPLFTAAALRRVHRCSGGVPRLINLLCDRSLLGAAVSRRMQVTPAIVNQAAREVHGSQDGIQPRRGWGLAFAASVLIAAAIGVWIGSSGMLPTWSEHLIASVERERQAEGPQLPEETLPTPAADKEPEIAFAPEPRAPAELQHPIPAQEAPIQEAPVRGAEMALLPPVPAAEDSRVPPNASESMLESTLASAPTPAIPRISMARSAPVAVQADADQLPELLLSDTGAVDELLRLWGVTTDAVVSGLDCRAVAAFGLDCEFGQGRWSDLRLFDRPVALELTLEDDRSGYAVISDLDEEHATIEQDGLLFKLPIAVLDERWSGEYFMLWRLPPLGAKVIGRGSGPEVVSWLRERLASLPGAEISAEPARYDDALLAEVKRFQARSGLSVDGVAGPQTLILLNNALAMADVPRLTQSP